LWRLCIFYLTVSSEISLSPRYLCSFFYRSIHYSILWQNHLYLLFHKGAMIPPLEILRALRWNGSSFRLQTEHFRAFYMDVTKFTSQKLEHYTLRCFPRVFPLREREKQNRKSKLNWEYVYEVIFTRVKAENCDRDGKLVSISADIKICDKRLRIYSWISANPRELNVPICDWKSRDVEALVDLQSDDFKFLNFWRITPIMHIWKTLMYP